MEVQIHSTEVHLKLGRVLLLLEKLLLGFSLLLSFSLLKFLLSLTSLAFLILICSFLLFILKLLGLARYRLRSSSILEPFKKLWRQRLQLRLIPTRLLSIDRAEQNLWLAITVRKFDLEEIFNSDIVLALLRLHQNRLCQLLLCSADSQLSRAHRTATS